MTNSAEAIASKIRAGYAEGAIAGARIHGSLAADKVEIHHLPAGPKDGIWDGPTWATALLEAVRSLQNAISDFRQEAEITVVGDEIRTVSTIKGALKDGTALSHTNRSVMTIKNGKIVKAINDNGGASESRQLLLKALSQSSSA